MSVFPRIPCFDVGRFDRGFFQPILDRIGNELRPVVTADGRADVLSRSQDGAKCEIWLIHLQLPTRTTKEPFQGRLDTVSNLR